MWKKIIHLLVTRFHFEVWDIIFARSKMSPVQLKDIRFKDFTLNWVEFLQQKNPSFHPQSPETSNTVRNRYHFSLLLWVQQRFNQKGERCRNSMTMLTHTQAQSVLSWGALAPRRQVWECALWLEVSEGRHSPPAKLCEPHDAAEDAGQSRLHRHRSEITAVCDM